MKISLNATKYINEHYGSAGDPAPDGANKLVEKIGAQLGAVEEVIPFGRRFEGAIVAKVVSVTDHPDSDHLHICMIDDGGKAEGVDRSEQGGVQVVCGASNVREGILVVWLPPGATVPETYGTSEPFVLAARPLRGQMSNGMLASARELGLSDDHEGILEIDDEVTPGTMFVDAYHLRDDLIIDIENKMFTHRPDCFGYLGVARELEGIQQRPYKSPDWYRIDPEFPAPEGEELKLEVTNEIPELVPRFTAIVIQGVQIKSSPVWLQVDLARAGIRSINNIVDYTNWYMLLTGQPIHAYDYDKVKAQDPGADHATFVIRNPHPGETITLLNGKEITPRANAMMVATATKLICVGGAMGGAETEVDAQTKNIIIEAANWDMYNIRKTSMENGIFSEAITRFNKGQSPLQNLATTWKITDQIVRYAGGTVASPVIDLKHLPDGAWERGNIHAPVTVGCEFINARLGAQLSAQDMQTLLTNVEFTVDVQDNNILIVTAPFWRTDIEIPEDVVEEVGRLYGYDQLPLQLPRRDITPQQKNPALELKSQLRTTLAASGASEVLTYAFVHGNLLQKVGQHPENAFQLSNALSPDLQYFRLSLTPSLLDLVHANIKAGYDQFALFEMNKVHCVGIQDPNEPDVPQEDLHLSLVLAMNDKAAANAAGAPYYYAKRYLEEIFPGVNELLVPLSECNFGSDIWGKEMCTPFEPQRSAVVVKDGVAWGVVGEFRPGVRKALKLPAFAAGFELGMDILPANRRAAYKPLPRYPHVDQDICLKVASKVTYRDVLSTSWNALKGVLPETTFATLSPVDIYQRDDDPDHKQVTLRLSVASYERTLTDEEVGKLLDHVAQKAADKLGAERI